MDEYFIGSDGELYHYGVKGMKWGVRRYQNKDGSLTRLGKKRAAQEFSKDYYETSKAAGREGPAREKLTQSEGFQRLYNNSKLKAMRDKYSEATKLEREYWTNPKLVDKYLNKSAEKDAKEFGISKEDMMWEYRYGDGDQNRSFDLYLEDRGVNRRDYYSNVNKARNAYNDACEKTTRQALKGCGNVPVTSVWLTNIHNKPVTRSTTIEQIVDVAMWNATYREVYGYNEETEKWR